MDWFNERLYCIAGGDTQVSSMGVVEEEWNLEDNKREREGVK